MIFFNKYALVILSNLLIMSSIVAQTPLLEQRTRAVQAALAQAPYILALEEKQLNPTQLAAQSIALADTNLLQLTTDPQTKQPLRSEVFSVYPARQSDYGAAPVCADGSCQRVEIYNYAKNGSILAIVQMSTQKVVRIGYLPNMQPDIPTHLKQLALDIAIESAAVSEALGFKPTPENALMADTKTALNRTRCERSKHLCVAPTFVKGEKALWAIVDLTDLKIAGLRWTQVGDAGPNPTERRVQNANLTECYCQKSNALERNGWKFNYILTSSDGLRVSEVDFGGKRVIKNAKLVDWHVSYSNTDGFGYSDAVGCPFFSSAAVIALDIPTTYDLVENGQTVGFVLSQNYSSEGWPTPCNYNYEQRFEFYNDGRFRMSVGSLGRGCGNNGTYRPVSRIAFEGTNNLFAEWSGKDWTNWSKEGWQLQKSSTPYTPEGWQYRITDKAAKTGFAVLANVGQMADGGRGDEAYAYITVNHPEREEGEGDLMTIGPCCNTDYQQGPENFMQPKPESLDPSTGNELVFWYVPQLKNDDRVGNQYCWAETKVVDGIYKSVVYPCFSGPLFVPIK
jgi:hypothetical protein